MAVVVKGYPDYTVDEQGNITTYRGTGRKPKRQLVGSPITPTRDHKGYLYVTLCKDGRRDKFFVHKLVAEAFLPNPHRKPQVNHMDGNKLNCKLSNLEWVTNQENHDHARGSGLYDSQLRKYKLLDPRGNTVEFTGLRAFCKANGLNPSHISAVACGKLKQHKGYKLCQS